jgi:5-formyltetrahydrofolate cyclo-ligase
VPDFAGEAEESRSTKVALRNRLITLRKQISPSERQSAAVAVQTATTHWVRDHAPSTTAAYVPVGSEPGGAALPEALARALPPGGRLLLPVLKDANDLDWALYTGPDSLAPGPRGLREPTGPRAGVDAVRHADLLIVPALAVDHAGHRLGRGGGSYDRALTRVDVGLIVALLHDGELLDAVPVQPHDRSVHAVVTPRDGLTMLRAT